MALMKLFAFARHRRVRPDQKGVTALEFALLAPVFLMLVFAALELSVALHNGNTAKWAVKRAARDVLVDNTLTQAQIQSLVDANLSRVGSKAAVSVSYTVDNSGSVPVGTITGTYTYDVNVPFLTDFTAQFPITVAVPHTST